MGSEITQAVVIDEAAILRSLNLNPTDPNVQALILVCREYGLDPVLKHMVLISGRPYVTRDGLLHVAHRSGQFDGIEVVEEGESDAEWWAKVSVYRKDMGRPFTYRGRYPKKDAKHMAKFGPEMAVKVAEVMALRRAFDVTGIGAAEERWDAVDVIEAEPVDPATDDQLAALTAGLSALTDEDRAEVAEWWKAQGYPPLTSGRLSAPQAVAIANHVAPLLAGHTDNTDPALTAEPDDEPIDVAADPDRAASPAPEHGGTTNE